MAGALHDIDRVELDALIEKDGGRLSFPADLEQRYLVDTHRYRARKMRRLVVPTLLIYNLFLISDFFVVPDVFALSLLLHAFVVTPYILVAFLLYGRIRNHNLGAALVGGAAVLMSGQILLVFSQTTSAVAEHYQYLALMVVIYANINVRLGFLYAVATTALLCMGHIAVLLASPLNTEAKIIAASIAAATAYLSLKANAQMEIDFRYGYLRRLRDRILRAEAESEAETDALTGLHNRRYLKRLEREILADPAEATERFAAVMIDIDHFKSYNDNLGHPAGDRCLQHVSDLLRAALPTAGSRAFRVGGEEFLVLLPHAGFAEACTFAERLRRALCDLAIPHPLAPEHPVVTASFGVSSAAVTGAGGLESLIAAADGALYAAKRDGRNCVWPPHRSQREMSIDAPVAGPAVG